MSKVGPSSHLKKFTFASFSSCFPIFVVTDGGASLLVNTTSLGMLHQPPLTIGLFDLPNDAVVTDIVYAPLETPLLATARSRGNQVVDGLGMLLHQARPGFRAWFGCDPDVTDDLRRALLTGEDVS